MSSHTLTLSSARRIVLVAYNPARGTVDFRHFRIAVKPHGVSRRVRRVLEGDGDAVVDLGRERDVADFVLRRAGGGGGGPDGYESAASTASSVAGDDADAVSLADDYVGRNNRKGQKKAVRLDEIGPRMELRLVKITEGVPGKEGGVIYHEFGARSPSFTSYSFFFFVVCVGAILTGRDPIALFRAVKKTKAETAAQKAAHAAKAKLRKERREEQERNVQRKKKEGAKGDEADGDDMDEDENEEEDENEAEEEGIHDDDWDEDEEISDGEVSEEEAEGASDGEESEEEPERPPAKKAKTRNKR